MLSRLMTIVSTKHTSQAHHACHRFWAIPLGLVLIDGAAMGPGMRAGLGAIGGMLVGGLGSAVAELLGEHLPTPMQRIGVRDTFAESGPYLAVIDKYGLTARHIVSAGKKVLERKAAES